MIKGELIRKKWRKS